MSTKEADLQDAQEELEKLRSETREKDKTLRKESREMESLKEEIASLQVRRFLSQCSAALLAYRSVTGGQSRTPRQERAYLGESPSISCAGQGSRHAR
jgi:hypothetical protein